LIVVNVLWICFFPTQTPPLPSFASITEMFKSKSIVLDVFGVYEELSPAKIFGINYDGSVIGRRVQGKIISLPKVRIIYIRFLQQFSIYIYAQVQNRNNIFLQFRLCYHHI